MKIPKKNIQEQMDYFSRQFPAHGEAGLILAWAMLKNWVDTYDVPENDGNELVSDSYRDYLEREHYKSLGD